MHASQPLLSDRFERALRLAAVGHQGQLRRTSGVPYVQHVVAVGWILERSGYEEDVVIAGLFHDLVEDTGVTLAEIDAQFGSLVSGIVAFCSEVKTDAAGRKRPWLDRKRDHLAALKNAPREAHAVILADKLHNLISIAADLRAGQPVWSEFHADREQVLWYYRAAIACCAGEPADDRLLRLAGQCRLALLEIEGDGDSRSSSS